MPSFLSCDPFIFHLLIFEFSSLVARIKEVAKFSNEAESERIISGMKWMGLLSSEKPTVIGETLLDTLCGQLEKLLSFKPGERDLVMLQHKFVVEWSNGQTVSFVLSSEYCFMTLV